MRSIKAAMQIKERDESVLQQNDKKKIDYRDREFWQLHDITDTIKTVLLKWKLLEAIGHRNYIETFFQQ